jgi:hypothetical protein
VSSYAKYCRDQAAECARRARLASALEVAQNCRNLESRWRRLAEKAELTDRSGGGSRERPAMEDPGRGTSTALGVLALMRNAITPRLRRA